MSKNSRSQPLVSVVIPSFNYARFMNDCVQSVVDQSLASLELVVVDDGSSDGSMAMLQEMATSEFFRRRFSGRIIVEANPRNLGAHETINRGISLSSGRYISILNADDRFGARRLERMIEAMSERNASFSFSAVEFIDENGQMFSRTDPFVQSLRRRQNSIGKYPSVGFASLASNVAISTGNFLFERRLFDEVGAFGNLRYCHDWDFLLRCLLVTEPLYVPEVSYEYRIHGANTFRSLGSIADAETALVYQNYFRKMVLKPCANKSVPNAECWPGVFEAFMSAFGLWRYCDVQLQSRPETAPANRTTRTRRTADSK